MSLDAMLAYPTFAVLPGSPALDKGKSFGLLTDQRGGRRTVDDPNIPNAPGGDGTDIGAHEAHSRLEITELERTVAGNIVHFRTETGFNYQVQVTPRLGPSASWSNVGSPVAGTNGIQNAFDPQFPPGPPERYFRVRLAP